MMIELKDVTKRFGCAEVGHEGRTFAAARRAFGLLTDRRSPANRQCGHLDAGLGSKLENRGRGGKGWWVPRS